MKLVKKLFGFFWDRSLLIFLIIGGLNTVVSLLLQFMFMELFGWEQYGIWGIFFSTLIPYAVCSVPSFYFNRKYSFQSKAPLGPSVARFAVIISACYFLSFGLNQLAVPAMRAAWFPGISEMLYTVVRLLGIQVVFTLLNYVGQRQWAFKQQ